MARMPDAEISKSEPLQILRGFREWAIVQLGKIAQWALKIIGYVLVGLGLLLLIAIGVVLLATLIPVLVIGTIILAFAVIVSALVDAFVDTANSAITAIRTAVANNKRNQEILENNK